MRCNETSFTYKQIINQFRVIVRRVNITVCTTALCRFAHMHIKILFLSTDSIYSRLVLTCYQIIRMSGALSVDCRIGLHKIFI